MKPTRMRTGDHDGGSRVVSGERSPLYRSGQDTGAPYKGWLDEVRYSTFDNRPFVVGDLLLIPSGSQHHFPRKPRRCGRSAAPFSSSSLWTTPRLINGGGTESTFRARPPASTLWPGDSGQTVEAVFDVVVTTSGISKTSTPATLRSSRSAPDVAAYRNVVQGEASLLAYFPATRHGHDPHHTSRTPPTTAAGSAAIFDGRTNRAFGQQTSRSMEMATFNSPTTPPPSSQRNGNDSNSGLSRSRGALGVPSDGTTSRRRTTAATAYYYIRAAPMPALDLWERLPG